MKLFRKEFSGILRKFEGHVLLSSRVCILTLSGRVLGAGIACEDSISFSEIKKREMNCALPFCLFSMTLVAVESQQMYILSVV